MSATTLTKTAAIAATKGTCSIWGRGTSWKIVGPYRSTEPAGPSTETCADSYPKAQRIATAWRARVALHLMGALDDEAAYAIDRITDDPHAEHTLSAMIDAGRAAYDTGPTAAAIAEAAAAYWDDQSRAA